MNVSTKLTRGHVAGLFAIVVVALGLGYLHFASGSNAVSVPSHAHAGQLTLHKCSYTTENGPYLAECGTVVVRENRHDPRSRLIALPVTRVLARSGHPGKPIFWLEGGPGLTNMAFSRANRFAGGHDVVLVGYRGADGTSRLDCPEVVAAREHSRGFLTVASFNADAAAFKSCAQRLTREGHDLAGYSLSERVDDIDLVRRTLRYRQIDLLSESAGTRTAMIYAWRYPHSIHRSVMIGVNPPGNFLWDAKTTGAQVRRYADLCAHDKGCSSRTTDLAATVHSAYSRIPGHWWFLPIKKGNVQMGAFWGLINATSNGGGPIASPLTIDTLLSIDKGDASGAWLLSVFAQLVFPRVLIWGDMAAVARSDAGYAKKLYASGRNRGSVIGSPGTDFLWAGGQVLNAWPANPDENEYTQVRDSNVETLLIGGNLDFATPPQNAAFQLLPHLENGHQVVLSNLGHTDDFWAYQPPASTRLISTFLDHGKVDRSLYRHNAIDFEPGLTQSKIAMILLAVLLGFALITVLSLLWFASRAQRRLSFTGKASVAVRTLYASLVGLGGWCLGAVIVLTALPSVPLDDLLLAVISVSPPIAIAVFSAWSRRLWLQTPMLGLSAAFSGALLGAWLGFHAAPTPGMGFLTATIGAIAAANLAAIGLDLMSAGRPARPQQA